MESGKDYPIKNYCEAIAFAINCDNLAFNFTDKIFTSESVWNSNSHGELFGVLNCAEIVRRIIDNLPEANPFRHIMDKIVKGGSENPNKDFSTCYGCLFMTLLFQMPDEFKKQVDEVFNRK